MLNFLTGLVVTDDPTNGRTNVVVDQINGTSGVLSVTAGQIKAIYSDGKATGYDYPLPSVLTTDATVTSLFSFSTTTGRRYYLSGFIEGLTSTNGTFLYELKGGYDNIAGTLTQRVSTPVNEVYESTSTPTIVVGVSGTNIIVTVAGIVATSIRWSGRIYLHEVAF